MSYQTFVQSSVTISKGRSITLVDDVAVPHHIANGTWDNTSLPLSLVTGMVIGAILIGAIAQPPASAGTIYGSVRTENKIRCGDPSY